MKRKFLAVICLVVLTVPSLAQQPAQATAPSKADVFRFMDLMQVRARMEQMMEGMKKAMKTGAEAEFKLKISQATPEQVERVDAMADAVFQDFPFDEMLDAMVPIYQRHLTKSDLDEVIAFYSSPAEKRLLKEQPAMMAEGMQVGQDIMLRKLPEMNERLNTSVAQLVDRELQKVNPSPKPVTK